MKTEALNIKNTCKYRGHPSEASSLKKKHYFIDIMYNQLSSHLISKYYRFKYNKKLKCSELMTLYATMIINIYVYLLLKHIKMFNMRIGGHSFQEYSE